MMNPPSQGGHLLNGVSLQNMQLQQQQIQQLIHAGLSAQQLTQLLNIQQPQAPQQLNGFGATSINSSIAVSQHAQAPQFVIQSNHTPTPVQQPQTVQTPQQQPQGPSLPWPTCTQFPLTRVPYFDVNSYKSVNLECIPSCDPNGLDLPLGDMNTLRFFFNLGVQQSKVLMLASKNNQHTINAEMQVSHVPQQQANVLEQLNQSHLLRQIAAQQQQAQQQAAAQQAAAQQAAQAVHVSQTPVLQSLTHQQQQLSQQNQLLMATARAHGLTPAHLAQFGIQTSDILQLSQAHGGQQQIQHGQQPMIALPTAVSAATVTPAMTRATPTAREIPSAKSSVGPDQSPDASALMLHQALLSINKQPNVTASSLHEARIQQLLGQQPVHAHHIPIHQGVDPMLKAMTAAAEVLKPVAVGGGSGDAAVSPRPPIPVDPSPPKALIEATRNQQAQTSPPTSIPSSLASDLLKSKIEPIIGAHRPASATAMSHSMAGAVPGKSSAPPSMNPEETPTHLFHLSEKHYTDAFTKNVNQAPNPIGIARPDAAQPSSSTSDPSTSVDKKEDDENKPALAPILMMSFLNSCMSNMKHTLNSSGLPVTLDANGQPVDFSSRPVDRIFQQARQQQAMNNIREKSPLKRKASPGSTSSEGITITEVSPSREAAKEGSPVVKVDSDERSDSGSEGGGKRLRIATDED